MQSIFSQNKIVQGLTLFFCAFLLTACDGPVKVNFILNNIDFAASDFPPDTLDEKKVFTIQEGSRVVISDASTPSNNIEKLFWDLDGDNNWDQEFEDKGHFSHTYNKAGFYKITLCVNNKETCISKWINVRKSGIENIDFSPVFTFIKPEKDSMKSQTSHSDIVVQTQNIFFRDELKLTVENRSVPFSFDETTGLLSANAVRLKPGFNQIAVSSIAEEGQEKSKRIYIEFDPPADYVQQEIETNPSSSITTSVSPAPVVSIKKPANAFRTKESIQVVEFSVANLILRSDLKVSINGDPVRYDRFNYSNGLWRGTLYLKEGRNIIEVKAITQEGESSESREVYYEPLAQANDN